MTSKESHSLPQDDVVWESYSKSSSEDSANPQKPDINIRLEGQEVINKVFANKTDQEIRNRYLSKLMCHRVWLAPIQQPRTHQNIVILDYDDTLLPTTFLDPSDELEMEEIVKIHKDRLSYVQDQVMTLLENFLRVSKVLIITNAKRGWVEYSSSILMPQVYKMINKYIPVISARGEFEH